MTSSSTRSPSRRDQGRHLVEHRRPGVARERAARAFPVYFVQDIETSYYPDDEFVRYAVLDSYRPEFQLHDDLRLE